MIPVLCVHDLKNDSYSSLQAVEEVENARRQFIIACRSKDSVLFHFKEDFELVQIGYFDPETGFVDCSSDDVVLQKGADVQ